MNAHAASLAPQPIGREAHARSLQLEIPAVVERLTGVLGLALVAVIVNKDGRSVQRWAAGETKPAQQDERTLRDTLQVLELMASSEAEPVVRAWFMGMNPQLEDASPAEAVSEGRAREVMAAARAYLNAD